MKKRIEQFIFPVGGFFCQFFNKKIVGLMQKRSLLAGDTN